VTLRIQAMTSRMMATAVATQLGKPAYRIALARMLAAQGRQSGVEKQIEALRALNIGGRLDRDPAECGRWC
jgi:hypothetical protein